MNKYLAVKQDGKVIYDIVIQDSYNALLESLEKLQIKERKICIVTEDGIAPLYLESVKEVLNGQCAYLTSYIFRHGEENKNLTTVNQIYQFLIEENFDRKDMLIALGGGVTGDLTGFVAATYLRGIDFVQLPTSLLSQVDSSIGGKTGVDYQAYKNMVGAFYMPKLVYINIATLQTLSDVQFRSGLGEVIKHGLIQDKEYYEFILKHKEEIWERKTEILAKIVEGSCRVKRAVVEKDPKEQGIRAYLNFGHTIGHAIEKMMEFSLTHGECVGIGSLAAARISLARDYLSQKEYEQMQDLYSYFHFPDLPEKVDLEAMIDIMKHDKKMEHGVLKFILLNKLGEAAIYKDVRDEEVIVSVGTSLYGRG